MVSCGCWLAVATVTARAETVAAVFTVLQEVPSTDDMTAVLPGNENGGRVITGNYLEITITMEITWKL